MNHNSHLFFQSAKSSLLYCLAHARFDDFCLVAKEVNQMIEFHKKGSGSYLSGHNKVYFENFYINFCYDLICNLDASKQKDYIPQDYKNISIPLCLEYLEKSQLLNSKEILTVCFACSITKNPIIYKEITKRWDLEQFLTDEEFSSYYFKVPSMKKNIVPFLGNITKLFEDQEIYSLHQKISLNAPDKLVNQHVQHRKI